MRLRPHHKGDKMAREVEWVKSLDSVYNGTIQRNMIFVVKGTYYKPTFTPNVGINSFTFTGTFQKMIDDGVVEVMSV